MFLDSDILYSTPKYDVMNSKGHCLIIEKAKTSHGRKNCYEKEELKIFKALAEKFGYELEE